MRKKKLLMHDEEWCCFLCGRNGTQDPLEWHHVFGAANRKLSEKYGLKVRLCKWRCHNGADSSVHMNKEVRRDLQERAQMWFEENYPDEDFVSLFGANYIGLSK